MTSDKIKIGSDRTSLFEALDMVERAGSFQQLKREDAMTLRLLAEEMVGTVKGVLSEVGGYLWVQADGRDFAIYLQSSAVIRQETKKQLLSVSKSGKNEAAKGILGKIADLFTNMIIAGNESQGAAGLMLSASMAGGYGAGIYSQVWSMKTYEDSLPSEEKKKEWDGLEKSILLNFSDDVLVGVKSDRVELVVKKKF